MDKTEKQLRTLAAEVTVNPMIPTSMAEGIAALVDEVLRLRAEVAKLSQQSGGR